MATFLTTIGSAQSRMMPGEKRVARRLEEKLPDACLCWYDLPVGTQGCHPDFIILDPQRGILVLEVKDWKLERISSCTKNGVILHMERGPVPQHNPLEQARGYAHEIVRALEKDPSLCEPGTGRLSLPWGYALVFANITRKAFEARGMDQVFEPWRVILQDEIGEATEPAALMERLARLLPFRMAAPLTQDQINHVRGALDPEIRVSNRQLSFSDAGLLTEPNILRVMDLQQEQLARSLGEGHRVIHGVAGSGKTMILVHRALQLSKIGRKPNLVLCYNRTLAQNIECLLRAKGAPEDRVVVRNFHRWCMEQLEAAGIHVPHPGVSDEQAKRRYFEELVSRTAAEMDQGRIAPAQYQAVLIDEGHDFHPDWLALAARMADPQTKHLLLLYDDAQSIYERGSKRGFSFKSLGIAAQGRTTILRLNYRNTVEILSLAAAFAQDLLQAEDAEEDGVPLLHPEGVGRHGPMPDIHACRDISDELETICAKLQDAHKAGMAWRDMAVIHRVNTIGEQAEKALERHQIPCWRRHSAKRGHAHYDRGIDHVAILTMHDSKGLEFPLVCIPALGWMPTRDQPERDEARLLYVAMTRATEKLVLTYSQESAFVQRIRNAWNDVREQEMG